jgi:UrcA family protein
MSPKLQSVNRVLLAHCAAALVACAFIVSSALAEEPVRSETVKFSDLNVNSSAGVEALYRRIHSAAKRVCAPPEGYQTLVGSVVCVKDAEARAIAQVNLPLLTAYYQRKTGDRTPRIAANR